MSEKFEKSYMNHIYATKDTSVLNFQDDITNTILACNYKLKIGKNQINNWEYCTDIDKIENVLVYCEKTYKNRS